MNAVVETIIQQIEDLTFEDRASLEKRLAERAEEEWRRDAETARCEALARGITQAQIDEAVERTRYRP